MAKQETEKKFKRVDGIVPALPEKPFEDPILSVWSISDKPIRAKRIRHLVEAANADFTGRYLEKKKIQLETFGVNQTAKFVTCLKSRIQN